MRFLVFVCAVAAVASIGPYERIGLLRVNDRRQNGRQEDREARQEDRQGDQEASNTPMGFKLRRAANAVTSAIQSVYSAIMTYFDIQEARDIVSPTECSAMDTPPPGLNFAYISKLDNNLVEVNMTSTANGTFELTSLRNLTNWCSLADCPEGPYDYKPVFSPDGQYIAWFRHHTSTVDNATGDVTGEAAMSNWDAAIHVMKRTGPEAFKIKKLTKSGPEGGPYGQGNPMFARDGSNYITFSADMSVWRTHPDWSPGDEENLMNADANWTAGAFGYSSVEDGRTITTAYPWFDPWNPAYGKPHMLTHKQTTDDGKHVLEPIDYQHSPGYEVRAPYFDMMSIAHSETKVTYMKTNLDFMGKYADHTGVTVIAYADFDAESLTMRNEKIITSEIPWADKFNFDGSFTPYSWASFRYLLSGGMLWWEKQVWTDHRTLVWYPIFTADEKYIMYAHSSYYSSSSIRVYSLEEKKTYCLCPEPASDPSVCPAWMNGIAYPSAMDSVK